MVLLRSARQEDVPAIAAIWNPIIRDTVITFWPTERGEDEIAKGVVAVKDLRRGEQFEVADDDLPRTLLVEREQWQAMR